MLQSESSDACGTALRFLPVMVLTVPVHKQCLKQGILARISCAMYVKMYVNLQLTAAASVAPR